MRNFTCSVFGFQRCAFHVYRSKLKVQDLKVFRYPCESASENLRANSISNWPFASLRA